MEGTDAETATLRERAAAYLVDVPVVAGPVVGLARRLGRSRRERLGLVGLVGLAVANVYHAVLEGTGGQTVGKRAVGIAVVGADGGPCSYAAAATRTAYRFVDWLPAGYLLGIAGIALTERRQRLGDLAANTVVVRTASDDERDGTEERG